MRRQGEFWYCNVCNAQNHEIDGECQFCECQGPECQRDNCSDPRHFQDDLPVSILDLADHRGLRKDERGGSTAEDFAAVGLAIFGGCVSCHASLAAYNAYPSKSGYWKCADCIGDDGYDTAEEANQAIFAGAIGRPK